MAEAITSPEEVEQDSAEVIDMFARALRKPSVPVATPEELIQYRKLLPRILRMLDEWEAVKGSGGCPIARRITSPD